MSPVAIVLNREAGSLAGSRLEPVRDLIATVAAGLDVAVRLSVVAPDSVGPTIRRALIDGCRRVVVGGGDGTISTAARVVWRSGAVLGVLPMGTLNHFAKDAGLPLDLEAALRVALTAAPVRADLAIVNGRPFINNSVIGIYPRLVRARDWQRSRLRRPKYLAMALSALQALRMFRTLPLAVVGPEGLIRSRTPLVFVGNNDYSFVPGSLPRRTTLDQGRLCLYLLRATSPWRAFLATCRALLRGVKAERDLVHVMAQELRMVSPKRRLRVALDGEVTYLRPPLIYRALPGALPLAAPPRR